MLETIREFGLEQLAANGESGATDGRHAAWCLALAERAAPELYGRRDQIRSLALLERERANLRAAFAWLIETGETESGLRLAMALVRFFYIRGYLSEGRDWLETALAGAP